MRPPPKRRCRARISRSRLRKRIGAAQSRGDVAAVKRLLRNDDGRCWGWALPNGLCRYHGGLSTGPRTEDGRQASYTARDAGRARYHARVRELVAAGVLDKAPGRPLGSRNRTPEERAAMAREREERRAQRQAMVALNGVRKAHKGRGQQREEAAEMQRRHDVFQTGQPREATGGQGASVHSTAPLGLPAVGNQAPYVPPARGSLDVPGTLDTLFDIALPELMTIGFVPTKGYLEDLEIAERKFVRILTGADVSRFDRLSVAATYGRLVRCEEAFGRTDGQADRLARLGTAFEDFEKRWTVEQTLAVIKAGQAAGSRMRGVRIEEPPRHSIAPWARR